MSEGQGQAHTPEEPGHVEKRLEAFFEYARQAFDAEARRHEGAEAKVRLYLAILAAALGLSSFAGEGVIGVLPDLSSPIQAIFAALAMCSYGLVVAALWSCLRALVGRKTPTPPISEEIARYYRSNPYLTVLTAMAENYLKAARDFRKVVDDKHRAAETAATLLKLAIVFGIAASITFVIAV